MGKKKPLTGRKKTLQLSDTRRAEGSQLSGKGIYAQPVTSSQDDDTTSQGQSPKGPSDATGMETRLADFMKEIHTLGSREDIEVSSTVVNPDASSAGLPVADQAEGVGANSIVEPQATSLDAAHQGQPVEAEAPPTFWHQVVDANSNHPYYWNPQTNEVSWTLPKGGVISYGGVSGGDEQGEPLDYFAYYDEGIVVPDRKGKGRGKAFGEGGEGKTSENSGEVGGEIGKKDGGVGEERKKQSEAASDATEQTGQGVSDLQDNASQDTTVALSLTEQSMHEHVGEVSMDTEPGGEESSGVGVASFGPPLPTADQMGVAELSSESRESAPALSSKRSRDGGEEGESQLMPTNVASTPTRAEVVSPPTKMARSSRSHGRGTPEERARKTRNPPAVHGTPNSAKQEHQALRFQASSLADELSRKLQFLHVSVEGLSDIQILQVKVKTRISDWEEGGLETKFLLTKLKQASEDLLSYEYEAAPKGWRFLWDSTTCRYQFQHLSTGEISWEYPLSSTTEDDESESSSQEEGEEEKDMVQSPPPPPPPPPQPVPQQPPKPVKPVLQTGLKMVFQLSSKPAQAPPTKRAMPSLASSSTPMTTSSGPPATKKTVIMSSTIPMASSGPPATKKTGSKAASLPTQVTRSLIRENIPDSHQRSKSKDLATPTAAYLGGGEMVPAPLPRAWKYENDEVNRRVRREGSIERREEVADKELSPTDVRRKLSKRVLPVHHAKQAKTSLPSKETSDTSDLPPPPPPPPSSLDKDAPSPPGTTGTSSHDDNVVKEAIQALSQQAKSETSPEILQRQNRDHGRREESTTSVSPTPAKHPPPPPPPSHSPPPPVPSTSGGEESEAKLRERLIERAKRLRDAANTAQAASPTLPDSEKSLQSENVEESTGLMYPNKEGKEEGSEREHHTLPTASDGCVSRERVKAGYTQIHVSYDRIEPETGESENVAIGDEVGGAGQEVGSGEVGEKVEVAVETAAGPAQSEIAMETEDKNKNDDDGLTVSKDEMASPRVRDGPLANKTLTSSPLPPQPMKEEEEKMVGEREGGEVGQMASEREEEGGMEGEMGKVETKGDEEGEISSGSSTPGPQTTMTPRCYMDREGGREEAKKITERQSTRNYDSEGHIGYSDQNTRYDKTTPSSSRRRYSRSRSRSRELTDRYGDRRRSSKHRRGDNSDYSDYGDRHYLDSDKKRYSSSKRRRHGDDYSESGSEYSDGDRYSRRRRDDYDSDRSRERSSDRRSRRSRADDERSSSRRHKHRSPRSRSRSKESRGSEKHRRHGDKSSGSSKKKKREKRDRRHKKDRKEDNGQPKPPKKVTVGRVGKVSSLRTLTSEGGEGGDMPLDKVQAAIADTIDEKRKQEREELERREEGRRLENKIQEHVQQHSGRSQTAGQQAAMQVMYPASMYPQMSPTDLSQGAAYYSTAYSGYQYPQYAAGQGWGGGGDWTGSAVGVATSGSGRDYATQYTQSGGGMGEQQYGNVTAAGTGVETGKEQYKVATAKEGDVSEQQQYGNVPVSGTGDQAHGDTSVSGTGNQNSVETSAPGIEEQQNEKASNSGTVEQKNETQECENAAVSGTGERQYGEMTDSAPIVAGHGQKPVPSPQQPSDVSDKPHPPSNISETAPSETVMCVTGDDGDDASKSRVESLVGNVAGTKTLTEPAVPAEEVKGHGGRGEEGGERDAEEMAECEMEIDSGGNSPVILTPPDPVISAANDSRYTAKPLRDRQTATTSSIPAPTGAAFDADSAHFDADSAHSDAKVVSGDGSRDGSESSPEPLPPGEEPDQRRQPDIPPPLPPPPPPQDEGMDKDVKEPESGGVEEKEVETEEPAPPGMESDQPENRSPREVPALFISAEVPLPSTDSPTSTPTTAEVTEVKLPPTPTEANQAPPAAPPTPPESSQQPVASPLLPTPSVPPSSSTPSTETTPSSSSSSTATTRVISSPSVTQAANAYYTMPSSTATPSSQSYDIAAAAAAYAHATKTGQPYQYQQQQFTAQQGYDYATYTAYLQQMSQAGMYGGGYVLGADGQYYQQASPYGAYAAAVAGAYGGYYSPGAVTAYSYASPSSYHTSTHQVSPASVTTATVDADKERKAKKGEFALPDNKEKQVKNMMSKWSSFKET